MIRLGLPNKKISNFQLAPFDVTFSQLSSNFICCRRRPRRSPQSTNCRGGGMRWNELMVRVLVRVSPLEEYEDHLRIILDNHGWSCCVNGSLIRTTVWQAGQQKIKVSTSEDTPNKIHWNNENDFPLKLKLHQDDMIFFWPGSFRTCRSDWRSWNTKNESYAPGRDANPEAGKAPVFDVWVMLENLILYRISIDFRIFGGNGSG